MLEFGELAPILDYLRWLASVLDARDIPVEHVGLSLDWLAEFFMAHMAPTDAHIVAAALRAARSGFEASPSLAAAPEPNAPEAWPECEAFEAHLLKGNHRGALETLDATLERGKGLVEAEMHVVQPALYRIGQKWQGNTVTVAQEHLSTSIASMAMTRGLLQAETPPLNGRKVLLACVQGNNHAVGLQMVADAFQLGGWDVQLLGANVPTASLVAHVGTWQPDVLGLSVSFPQQLPVVKDIVARLTKSFGDARPRIMAGGLAINRFERLAAMVGSDAWSTNAAAALATGERLVAERRVA